MTVSIDTAAVSFGVKMGALRLLGGRVEMYLKRQFLVSASSLNSNWRGKLHLFATLPIFPMLIPQSSEPSLFSDHPLVLLERLTNCARSDLGVFVVPVIFVQSGHHSRSGLKGKGWYVKN